MEACRSLVAALAVFWMGSGKPWMVLRKGLTWSDCIFTQLFQLTILKYSKNRSTCGIYWDNLGITQQPQCRRWKLVQFWIHFESSRAEFLSRPSGRQETGYQEDSKWSKLSACVIETPLAKQLWLCYRRMPRSSGGHPSGCQGVYRAKLRWVEAQMMMCVS